MNKIKITQEQADAIEWLLKEGEGHWNHEDLIKEHVNNPRGWNYDVEPINGMPLLTLVDALRVGYEVEPEFKVGDWIHVSWSNTEPAIHKVIKIGVRNIDGDEGGIEIDWDGNSRPPLDIVRPATPSEIAEEKERRWWKGHGRDVWELREDDILDYLGDLLIVDSFDSEEVYFKSNKHDSSPNKYSETPSYVQKNFKVVALSESRLDVKK